MKHLKLILILVLLKTLPVFSQTSIPSELMNKPRTEELYKVRENNIENLTVTEVNYLKNETYTNKWIYNYTNDSIISGRLFKNDELKSIFEYVLNQDKKIIESKVLFHHSFGLKERLHIKYTINDSLKILTFLDANLNIQRTMIVQHDSLKSPIKITSITNNQIEAMETADYNYKLNTYEYKVYNNAGELVLEKIEHYNHDFIIEKNDYGDIVKMFWPISQNRSVITFEYKYDNKNNWVKRVKKIAVNGKAETSTEVRRVIKYKL